MPDGSDLQKSIDAAEKGGVDVSDFKGYEKYCKTVDEMEKIAKLIGPAIKAVEKFVEWPTPEASRDVAIFFKKQQEFIALSKGNENKSGIYDDIAKGLMKSEKDKAKLALLQTISKNCRGNTIALFEKSNILYEDLTARVVAGVRDRHKRELKAFEDDQKREEEIARRFAGGASPYDFTPAPKK